MLNTIYVWLMKSSEDPSKTSLTIKALASGVITIITILLGFANVQVGSADLTKLVDAIIALTQAIAFIASTLTTVYALVRKITHTLQGTNQAINSL